MKRFGLLGFIILFTWQSYAQDAEINWLSFEQAIALNKKNPKKILVDVYTDWCYYCKVMDKKTYSNPKVAAYINKHFYPVKFNAEQKENLTFNNTVFKFIDKGRRGYHEFAIAILDGKLSYPTTVFFDTKEQVITRLPGYLTVKNYEPILVFLAEDYYQTKEWDSFIKSYKNVF
jgi:thioredoxin-related protein